MWQLYNLATGFGQRPSSWLGLDPVGWEAYNLDLAVLQVGRYIEGKLAERDKDGKPTHKIEHLSSDDPVVSSPFASFKASGVPIEKMKVPESGVW